MHSNSALFPAIMHSELVTKVHPKATYQDVMDAPPNMTAELIGGQLYLHPRPAKPHTFSASALGAELNMMFGRKKTGHGGWWIMSEPEIHLGEDVVVPDIAGWLRSEVPEFSLDTAYFTTSPTWICEVLSPGREPHDRTKKLQIYGKSGVKFAWLVHPTEHTLEVYAYEAGRWVEQTKFTDNARVQAVPFQIHPLELEELWL